jgi:hypothetical protein
VRQYKVKAFDSTKKSFLIELASVNVTGDDVNLIVWVSVYQDFKNISDFYSISFENRKSLIIIEEINVADHKLISFLFIIQRQRLMQN